MGERRPSEGPTKSQRRLNGPPRLPCEGAGYIEDVMKPTAAANRYLGVRSFTLDWEIGKRFSLVLRKTQVPRNVFTL